MKTSTKFKETIKNYLDQRAAEDELFAVTYKKENKNLEECCNYVAKCAQEGKCQGYDDSEVFGWAVHYYDEDDIKNIKPISGQVVVNHHVDLTETEMEEARATAMERVIEDEKKKIKLTQKVKLSSEELAEVKAKAVANAVADATNKMMEKKKSKASPKVTTDESKTELQPEQSQGSLF